MNYSDISRTIIYEDVNDINHFLGDDSVQTLEREFYERLIKLPFIKDSEKARQYVRMIFNNACYVCLLIILDGYSSCDLKCYTVKASYGTDNEELNSHIAAATMAMIYNWLGIHVKENNFLGDEPIDI